MTQTNAATPCGVRIKLSRAGGLRGVWHCGLAGNGWALPQQGVGHEGAKALSGQHMSCYTTYGLHRECRVVAHHISPRIKNLWGFGTQANS